MTFCGPWDRLIARYYLTRNEQVIAEWFSKDVAGGVSVKFPPLPERSELAWSDHQLEQYTYWYGPLLMMMLVGVVLVLVGFNVVPGLHYTQWL